MKKLDPIFVLEAVRADGRQQRLIYDKDELEDHARLIVKDVATMRRFSSVIVRAGFSCKCWDLVSGERLA